MSPKFLSYRSMVSSLLFTLFFVHVGCEHAEPVKTEVGEAKFSDIQKNIFSQNCALSGCHTQPAPAAGMDLSQGSAYQNLVNVPSTTDSQIDRVEPGDSDNSMLIMRLEGTVMPQMPLRGNPLPQQQINTIREWIDNGAENN